MLLCEFRDPLPLVLRVEGTRQRHQLPLGEPAICCLDVIVRDDLCRRKVPLGERNSL